MFPESSTTRMFQPGIGFPADPGRAGTCDKRPVIGEPDSVDHQLSTTFGRNFWKRETRAGSLRSPAR